LTTDVLALSKAKYPRARQIAWPFLLHFSTSGSPMTQTNLKSPLQAEIAFGHTQTQFFARGHAVEELVSIVQAREAKTLRLREARPAKEAKVLPPRQKPSSAGALKNLDSCY
jgi:hypothetical protein